MNLIFIKSGSIKNSEGLSFSRFTGTLNKLLVTRFPSYCVIALVGRNQSYGLGITKLTKFKIGRRPEGRGMKLNMHERY